MEPVNHAWTEAMQYGVLGMVAFAASYGGVKLVIWIVAQFEKKDLALAAQQAKHEEQLERIYTAHKAEIAAMNEQFITELQRINQQQQQRDKNVLDVVGNNTVVMRAMQIEVNALKKIVEKLEPWDGKTERRILNNDLRGSEEKTGG
jgi:predicted membrane protein